MFKTAAVTKMLNDKIEAVKKTYKMCKVGGMAT